MHTRKKKFFFDSRMPCLSHLNTYVGLIVKFFFPSIKLFTKDVDLKYQFSFLALCVKRICFEHEYLEYRALFGGDD